MNAAQADEYIGIEWRINGTGPDAYNCWTFLAHIQRVYFATIIPLISLDNPAANAELHKVKLQSGDWQIVKNPSHGDGALLKGGLSPHVGIYLDVDGGGVLHCAEGMGVVFTPANSLSIAGYARTVYYKLKK